MNQTTTTKTTTMSDCDIHKDKVKDTVSAVEDPVSENGEACNINKLRWIVSKDFDAKEEEDIEKEFRPRHDQTKDDMKESIQHDKDDQLEENDVRRQNSFDYYGGGNENNGNRNDHGGNDFEDWANLIDEIDQGGADDDDDSVDLLEESLQKIEDELQRQIDEEIEGAFQKQMDDYFEDCFRQMTMNHDEDEDYGYEDECSSLGDEPWLGPVSGRFHDLRLSSLGPVLCFDRNKNTQYVRACVGSSQSALSQLDKK